MFKRSFLMVASVLLLVFTSAFAGQMLATRNLPSSYDPGLGIEQAFKTSKVPLLVEFYTDDCSTCRQMTPVVHHLYEEHYKTRLTLVMLDVADSANADVAQLFGVDSLPGLFVFDAHHMKKQAIPAESFTSERSLRTALDSALAKTETKS